MASNTYEIEYAKTGRAGCKNKKCEHEKVIEQGSVRIGKVHPSPFSDDAMVADWYHPDCFFEAMLRAQAKTIVPTSAEDFKGWENMSPADEAWLQPMLDEFTQLREQKLAGKLPGKAAPKLKSVPAHIANMKKASDMDVDEDIEVPAPKSKASAPKKPKATATPAKTAAKLEVSSSAPSSASKPTSASTSGDKYGLSTILDKKWHRFLSPLIKALPEVDILLSTFAPHIPNKSRLFEALKDLDPAQVQLVIIKDKPFTDAKAASGYAFHNSTDKTLETANPQLSGLLKAARSHSNAQGNLIDWETYNSRTPTSWFAGMKNQGVLMMNAQLSIDPATAATTSTTWDAVMLKILKTIFSERKKAGKGGVVVVFSGKNLEQLKRSAERINTRFQAELAVRFLSIPLPDAADFASTDNPIETIDALLLETGNMPPKWFPEETAMVVDELPTKTNFVPAPAKTAKMTSRIQLTSLDGKANLDVGKFHRDPANPGTFIMRAVDLEAGDKAKFFSSHVARFSIGKGGDLTITPLTSNPICHGDASFTPTRLDMDVPFKLKRGDIIGLLGAEFQYRVDPYDFDNPPKNKYHVENGEELEDDEERAQDAKRPLSDVLDDEEEKEHVKTGTKPSAKKAKKANPAMDWLEDDGGDLDEGDYDYKPNKADETASDYVIDDGEGNHHGDDEMDSGSEDMDELMAKVAKNVKPMCKYGAACYRKNPQHLAQFRHPAKDA